MSLLYQNTLSREVEQNIPAQLRFKREANEDVILSRNKWKVTPMSSATLYGHGSGTNANAQQRLLVFKILSDNWIDPQSLRLRGRVQTGGTGVDVDNIFTDTTNTAYLEPVGDGVDSLIKSIRTSINSREFETIDQYNILFPNLLTVASCPRDYYNSAGTMTGNWKYLNKLPSNYDNPVIANAVEATAGTVQAMVNSTRKNMFVPELYISQMYADGFDFSIPLHLGIFRTGTFIPPRVSIEIEINFDDVDRCFLDRGPGPVITNQYYQLSNVAILVDQVQVHPSYMEKYNEVIASKGLALETDVYATVSNVVPASTSMVVNINRGVSRLRSMYCVMPLGNSLTNFLKNDFNSVKYTVNGVAFPSSDGAVGTAEAYDCLMQSLGQLNDYNSCSLLDFNKYNGTEYGWRVSGREPEVFILGQDFQRSSSRASGLDTAVTGGIIKLELAASANMTAGQMYTFMHFDRGLLIKSDGIVLSE